METRKENIRFGNKSRGAFTLMELLVVMAIIVLMLVITMPSIVGLLQGQGMTKAIDTVSGTLEKARSTAMAQSTYTWVGLTATTINGQPGIVLCAVSSLDGTANTASTNLRILRSPTALQNISIASALTKWVPTTQTSSTLPLPNGSTGGYTFTATYLGLPLTFSAGTVLCFTPQGEAVLQQNAISPWIEIGLQQQYGSTVIQSRVASVLISGISGQQVISY